MPVCMREEGRATALWVPKTLTTPPAITNTHN